MKNTLCYQSSYQVYCADMAELVDATDLKSVGTCSRAGSIPAFRTTFEITLWKQRVFLCLNPAFWGVTQQKIAL